MKTPRDRIPLFERLKKGMEEAIRHSKGEIALTTTVIEIPDPPPTLRAEEVVRLRLDHAMSQAVFAPAQRLDQNRAELGARHPQAVAGGSSIDPDLWRGPRRCTAGRWSVRFLCQESTVEGEEPAGIGVTSAAQVMTRQATELEP